MIHKEGLVFVTFSKGNLVLVNPGMTEDVVRIVIPHFELDFNWLILTEMDLSLLSLPVASRRQKTLIAGDLVLV